MALNKWRGLNKWGLGVSVGIPIDNRGTYQDMQKYISTVMSTSSNQNNEVIMEWLLSEGVPLSTFNTMMSLYLEGLGYSGSYNEKLSNWKRGL